MRTCIAFLFCLVSLAAFPESNAVSDPEAGVRLPVRRVVLYKSGVGYFEHDGLVRGSQNVTIDFTTAQLNDVLKSLTVLDSGKGRVSGISYNTNAPVDKLLSGLRLPLGQQTTVAEFLSALRGSHVDIRSAAFNASGRLLSVEHRERMEKDQKTGYDVVSLITDTGEVRTFELTPTASIRIGQGEIREEVGRYLRILSSARDQDLRRMTIAASGSGERTLQISYISEVPVWKSTYRIVLPDDAAKTKALLQGWAIVDNTVGEDWKSVQLSLVAGAPQSFVQDISSPYYARRPVVALPQTALLSPQTHEGTLRQDRDALGATETVEVNSANGAIGGPQSLPLNGRNYVALSQLQGGVANGSGAGVGSGYAAGTGGGAYRLTAGGLMSTVSAAQSHDLGDLFEYSLKEPVTIQKNQSALVPIAQANIDAEKVTLWSSNDPYPLRAIWMKNTSNLTLDGGTFNIIDGNAFAGEGIMDPIKPGERRLLSYAADQAVRVTVDADSTNSHVVHLKISRGALMQTSEQREVRFYNVRNEDAQPRTIVVEHPARPGWKLVEGVDKPAETSANFHRFRIAVGPHDNAKFAVAEVHPIAQQFELVNFTDDLLAIMVQQQTIDPETEKALRRVLDQKNRVAQLQIDITARQVQISEVSTDQQRLRENMKALKGSAEERELVQRYTREMNEQEDRIADLRHELVDLQQKRKNAQADLNQIIEQLSLETTAESRAGAGL